MQKENVIRKIAHFQFIILIIINKNLFSWYMSYVHIYYITHCIVFKNCVFIFPFSIK